MKPAEHGWRHDQLASDLATHLRANTDRMVWQDMQLGPSGSRRPDVYTIPKTYSRFCPMAYEVKISVSDFRSDVTSGKWQEYLNFASGVVFAVPAGLVAKADIPARAGLIVRHENVWRFMKKPTLEVCDGLPESTWMKLLIDGVNRAAVPAPSARMAVNWINQERMRKQFGDEFAMAYRNRDAMLVKLQQAIIAASEEHSELEAKSRDRLALERERMEEERQGVFREMQALANVLGCDPDSFSIRQALRAARPENDREKLRDAYMDLERTANTITKAANEMRARAGIEES